MTAQITKIHSETKRSTARILSERGSVGTLGDYDAALAAVGAAEHA